jgi:hypothetical protein
MHSRDDVGDEYFTIEEMAAQNKLRELDPSVKESLQFNPDELSEKELSAIAAIMRAQQYIKKINEAQKNINNELRAQIQRGGEIEGVKQLLKRGASANACYAEDSYGSSRQVSILEFALRLGKHEIAQLLIEDGRANVAELEKITGVSLLKGAVLGHGSAALINLLLRAGANIRAGMGAAYYPESPLDYAVKKRQYHLIDALSDGGKIYYKVRDNDDTKDLFKAEIHELFTTNDKEGYQALLNRMNKEMENVYDMPSGPNVRSAVRGILIEVLDALEKKLASEKDRGVVEAVKVKLECIAGHLNVIQTRDGGKPKTAMEKLLSLIKVLNGRLGNMVSGNPNSQYGRPRPNKETKEAGQKMTVYKQG